MAFPEKSEKEIKKIAWASYRNLTDIILESFKGMVISEKTMRKRFQMSNPELLDSFAEQNKNVIFLSGHLTNWEWAIIADKYLKHKVFSVFRPLKNPKVNEYMKANRERFGMKLLAMKDTRKAFEHGENIVLVLIADQNPDHSKHIIWVDFLGIDTPCIHGPEAYAKKFNTPIIFGNFNRIKRGYYRLDNERLIDEPLKCEKDEITKIYMKRLEECIRKNPENWVWTHKRWKHKRENGKVLVDYYYKK